MKNEFLKKTEESRIPIRFRSITYPGVMKNRFYISEYGHVYDPIKDKFREPSINKHGYKYINLNTRVVTIHRLVAWEFCPNNRDMNLTVDHLDGNKLNNWCDNLEWVTLEENIRRAYNNSYTVHQKYDEDLIRKICEIYELGKSPIDVYRIIRGTNNTPRGDKQEEALYRLLVGIRKKETRMDIVSQYNFPDEYSDGTRIPSDKTLLTSEQIKIVAQLYMDGKSYVEILNIFNINRSNEKFDQYYYLLMRICKRQSWTNITDPIFKNFNERIVTVRNGGRFTEYQVRELCKTFRDGNKNPVSLLAGIGIRKGDDDYQKYYDGLMSIIHGKCWTRISSEYFTPTTITNKESHDLDEEFIFEMLNHGYETRDIVRMYGLGSKAENRRLYDAIIGKVKKFRRIRNTLEFHLSSEDIENNSIDIWACQF